VVTPMDAAWRVLKEDWGSLQPDVVPPDLSGDYSPSQRLGRGATRDVYPSAANPQEFVDKVGSQDARDIALGHAAAKYGYRNIPETPIYTNERNRLAVTQPRMDTQTSLDRERALETVPFHEQRMEEELGKRPISRRLLTMEDTKAANIGFEPESGDVMHIDPMFFGVLGNIPHRQNPHNPARLASQSLRASMEQPETAEQLAELEQAYPGPELFEPWGARGKGAWHERAKPALDNIKFARSVAEDPWQRRLFEYGYGPDSNVLQNLREQYMGEGKL